MAQISFNRKNILTEVATITGYTAKSIEGAIDRISVTDDESKVIDSLISSAIENLLTIMSEYRPVMQGETITVTTPSCFNDLAIPLISADIEAYAAYKACAEWFEMSGESGKSATYQDKAQTRASSINQLLSWRKRPTRNGSYI